MNILPGCGTGQEEALAKQLIILGLPKPEVEFQFHRQRKWRFDVCYPDRKVAIEIEGGIGRMGRHQRPGGFLKDIEKYNAAGLMGYRIFRFTPQQVERWVAADFIVALFRQEGWSNAHSNDRKV